MAGAGVSPIITPGRMAETCCSIFRICWESESIFAFCRSIFFVKASSSAASDLSRDGAWAEAVVQIIAARKKEKEQRAKRFMEAILAEREDGGKSRRAVATPLRGVPDTADRNVATTTGQLAFR